MNGHRVIHPKGLHIALSLLLAMLGSGCEDRTGPTPRPDPQPDRSSVTLTPTQPTVAAFDTIILTAMVRDETGRVIHLPSVIWTSSDAAVATALPAPTGALPWLSFATVLGVSPGSVTITATSGTASATALITVGPPVRVASVTVTPESATLTQIGQTFQLAATLRDANGDALLRRPTSWSSDNEAVATVDPTGLVSAVGDGSATVTATCEGVNGTAAITVVQGFSVELAFVSQRDGNEEIYGMNADGSVQIRLTNNTGRDGAPTWSPQGARIAFQSAPYIYVMNADGGTQTRLNVAVGCCLFDVMAWSPDGQAIAFTTPDNPYDGIPWHVAVVNLAGGTASRLAPAQRSNIDPVWSPDGRRIVFRSYESRDSELYVVNAPPGGAGTPFRLTNSAGEDRDPTWSLDGQKIAFVAERNGNKEIYVMNADGSAQTNLTNNSASDAQPQWSPDGQKIAFTSYRDGNWEIYVMTADGSAQINLTNNAASEGGPQWSPDGQKIAFVSDRDAHAEIYVMNADGSGQTNLTNNQAHDVYPRWRP